MNTTALLAIGALFLISGCASTDNSGPTVRIDPNARWIVVSSNLPVSSPLMERGDTSRIPPRPASFLLAPNGQNARQEIDNSGITPLLRRKMLDGEVLTVADIEELGRNNVSEDTMLRYIRNTPVVYILTIDDINRLQQAGVGQSVIDHMLATVQDRPVQVVHRYIRYSSPRFYDPWWGYSRFYVSPSFHRPRRVHHVHHVNRGPPRGGRGVRVLRSR